MNLVGACCSLVGSEMPAKREPEKGGSCAAAYAIFRLFMKVHVVLGTRPEAIKLAPVIEDLRRDTNRITCVVVNTGQHRDIVVQALTAFGLRADVDLGAMRADQSLGSLTSRLFYELDNLLARDAPDWVLVQGDTTSAMVAATVAFYHRIAVGHV